jgi:hypothetical protein
MADITTRGLTCLYMQVPTLAKIAAIRFDPSGRYPLQVLINFYVIYLKCFNCRHTNSNEIRKITVIVLGREAVQRNLDHPCADYQCTIVSC